MKKIVILGSTGSVGTNTLKVVKKLNGYCIYGLFCGHNLDLLNRQAEEYNPEIIGTFFENNTEELKEITENKWKVLSGIDGACRLAVDKEVDILVIASAGSSTYKPLIKALETGKRVATANKETLVAFSTILKDKIKDLPGEIIPIDSEHSGIYQSLLGSKKEDIKRIILPASGGPFYMKESFNDITPEDALNHPNWKMGNKVTIDSATLMNKGLEVIEASVLFDLRPDQIEVVIHPQSIIHGIVEFKDGSFISQLSVPDMKIPIQFALTVPEHKKGYAPTLDISKIQSLSFQKVDEKKFPFIPLCYYVLEKGGTLPAVLVAADEVAVSGFLMGKIEFTSIMDIVINVINKHNVIENPDIEDIISVMKWAAEKTEEMIH